MQHLLGTSRGRALPALAALLVLLAGPAAAETRGGGVLHSFVGCEAAGFEEDEAVPVRARYVPRERVGGEFSAISLFFPEGGAENVQFRGEFEPMPGFRRMPGRQIWSFFTSPPERYRVRVLERTVLEPAGGDFFEAFEVQLRIRMRNLFGLPGCQADAGLVVRVYF